MTMDRIMSGVGGFDDGFDDEYFLDQEDGEEADWPRPEWLHADCLNVGFALEVGTCCKNPDNRLVGVAVDLADLVDLALSRLGNAECETPAAELGYRLKLIPGLLAQIHAIAPRLNPIGRGAAALPGRPPGQRGRPGVRATAARGPAGTPMSPTGGPSSASSARCCRTACRPCATGSAGRSRSLPDPVPRGQARPSASAAAWAQARDAP